jgi:hypothetical protein
MMLAEERKNIIRGLVRSEKGWVSIEEKVRTESLRRKKIETGLVFFQGEWISIEEKIARVSLSTVQPQAQQPIVMNKTINQQTYNVYNDNRTMQENVHEHRHVHIGPDQLGRVSREKLEGPTGREITFDKKKQIGQNGMPKGPEIDTR